MVYCRPHHLDGFIKYALLLFIAITGLITTQIQASDEKQSIIADERRALEINRDNILSHLSGKWCRSNWSSGYDIWEVNGNQLTSFDHRDGNKSHWRIAITGDKSFRVSGPQGRQKFTMIDKDTMWTKPFIGKRISKRCGISNQATYEKGSNYKNQRPGNTQQCLNQAQSIRAAALVACGNDFNCLNSANKRADETFNSCYQQETGVDPNTIPPPKQGALVGSLNKSVDDFNRKVESGDIPDNSKLSAAEANQRRYLLDCAVQSFDSSAITSRVYVTNQCGRDILVYLCIKNVQAGWKKGTSGVYVAQGAKKLVYSSGFDNNQTTADTDQRSTDYEYNMQVTGRYDDQRITPCEEIAM